MPWSTSDRRASLPRDWHKQRARAWRTAGGRCQAVTDGQRCRWVGRLNGDGGQADHINGPDDPTLQWLCPDHHKAKTQREALAGAAATRALSQHPRERHPGLA